MTQKQIILKLLSDEPQRQFYSYELAKASTKYGWLGLSGDRRARLEGGIEAYEEVNKKLDEAVAATDPAKTQ